MPYSYGLGKDVVKTHLLKHLELYSKILDVGAGAGTYGALLRNEYPNIDALEIFKEYINMFGLNVIYRRVFVGDITVWDISGYDYLIMGDVLEHLSFYDASRLLQKIDAYGKRCMVAVPYLFEQGEEFGNAHEAHLQPDLSPIIMARRYPQLRPLVLYDAYGYYVNYDF